MNVEIQDSGPSRKTLKVVVSPEQVKSHVQKVFRAANQQVQMKGFRPGKIPPHVLKAKLGDSILAEAKESILNETFQEAMRKQDFDIVGTPRLDVSQDPLDEEKSFEYSVDIDIRPEVQVGDIKSIVIERQPTEATDEDLEGSLEQLAQSKRKLQAVDDTIQDGDFAKVNLSYRLGSGDAAQEVTKKEGLQINSGIPIRGTDSEEFKNKLLEQGKGAKILVPITYPDSFEKEEARGKEGDVEIEILEVVRFVAPTLDDEFAKTFDFDSMDALREDLRGKISEQKSQMDEERIDGEILDKLFAQNEFVLPVGLIEEEISARAKAYAEDLERQGASKDDAQRQVQASKEELAAAARSGIRNLFLVEAIAKKQKLFVTETDIEAELKRIASENETSLQEVQKYFEEKKLFGELRMQLMNAKVREYLRKTAQLVDSKDAKAEDTSAS